MPWTGARTDDVLDHRSWGLARWGHHLVWRSGGGRLRWAPWQARRAVVVAWNWIACRLLGHRPHGCEWLEEPEDRWWTHVPNECTACGRRWPCDGQCGRPDWSLSRESARAAGRLTIPDDELPAEWP